jgi:hypothetical protein
MRSGRRSLKGSDSLCSQYTHFVREDSLRSYETRLAPRMRLTSFVVFVNCSLCSLALLIAHLVRWYTAFVGLLRERPEQFVNGGEAGAHEGGD